MWDPQRLTTLWTSPASYTDSFTLLFILPHQSIEHWASLVSLPSQEFAWSSYRYYLWLILNYAEIIEHWVSSGSVPSQEFAWPSCWHYLWLILNYTELKMVSSGFMSKSYFNLSQSPLSKFLKCSASSSFICKAISTQQFRPQTQTSLVASVV
jgi:hypothetical protein